MVKVKSPLLSREARGAIYGNIVFSVRKSGQQVRFQKPPVDRRSSGQISRRLIYSNGVDAWHSLTSEEKQVYIVQAKEMNMTGYNLYMRTYLLSPPPDPDSGIFGIAIFGLAIFGQD